MRQKLVKDRIRRQLRPLRRKSEHAAVQQHGSSLPRICSELRGYATAGVPGGNFGPHTAYDGTEHGSIVAAFPRSRVIHSA
jgi:hypothetical protein